MKSAPAPRFSPSISMTLCDMTEEEHNTLAFLGVDSYAYHPSFGMSDCYTVKDGFVHISPSQVSFPISECEFVFFKGETDE